MLTYISGGARSGKSLYATELARHFGPKIVYVATCSPRDAEMRQRVERHQSERPVQWTTVENPVDLRKVLDDFTGADGILVDCLTLYVSQRIVDGDDESAIYASIEEFCNAAAASRLQVVLVSNEVGCGLVPETPLGRKFRDIAGRANQIAARIAREAILMVSGLPIQLKKGNAKQVGRK